MYLKELLGNPEEYEISLCPSLQWLTWPPPPNLYPHLSMSLFYAPYIFIAPKNCARSESNYASPVAYFHPKIIAGEAKLLLHVYIRIVNNAYNP